MYHPRKKGSKGAWSMFLAENTACWNKNKGSIKKEERTRIGSAPGVSATILINCVSAHCDFSDWTKNFDFSLSLSFSFCTLPSSLKRKQAAEHTPVLLPWLFIPSLEYIKWSLAYRDPWSHPRDTQWNNHKHFISEALEASELCNGKRCIINLIKILFSIIFEM